MKHTKEPWFTKCDDSGWFIDNECTGERPVCINVSGVDATRIVECVNACEGIENPQEAIKELVEACEVLSSYGEEGFTPDINLKKALKKVKGKS